VRGPELRAILYAVIRVSVHGVPIPEQTIRLRALPGSCRPSGMKRFLVPCQCRCLC
jgi:hypothetical protein